MLRPGPPALPYRPRFSVSVAPPKESAQRGKGGKHLGRDGGNRRTEDGGGGDSWRNVPGPRPVRKGGSSGVQRGAQSSGMDWITVERRLQRSKGSPKAGTGKEDNLPRRKQPIRVLDGTQNAGGKLCVPKAGNKGGPIPRRADATRVDRGGKRHVQLRRPNKKGHVAKGNLVQRQNGPNHPTPAKPKPRRRVWLPIRSGPRIPKGRKGETQRPTILPGEQATTGPERVDSAQVHQAGDQERLQDEETYCRLERQEGKGPGAH